MMHDSVQCCCSQLCYTLGSADGVLYSVLCSIECVK